jgi:DHA2 family methylenomycin A resistance protein-like MFS transporter
VGSRSITPVEGSFGSGVAAGVLNSTRQTGSVIGVALFGSLIEQTNAFMSGTHAALIISAALLIVAAGAVLSALFHPKNTSRGAQDRGNYP